MHTELHSRPSSKQNCLADLPADTDVLSRRYSMKSYFNRSYRTALIQQIPQQTVLIQWSAPCTRRQTPNSDLNRRYEHDLNKIQTKTETHRGKEQSLWNGEFECVQLVGIFICLCTKAGFFHMHVKVHIARVYVCWFSFHSIIKYIAWWLFLWSFRKCTVPFSERSFR